MFSPWVAGNGKHTYTSEDVDGEVVTGLNSFLGYSPLVPGSVVIDNDGQILNDDGAGNLMTTGVTPEVAGEINYANGNIVLDAGIVTTLDEDAEATYKYNIEYAPTAAPDIELKVREITIRAKTRKLRAQYAFDAAYDLQMQHGFDVELELAEAAAAEIRHEVDNEIIYDLMSKAGLAGTWNSVAPLGVSEEAHLKSFLTNVIKDSNKIFQATRKASGNFLVIGKSAADVIETYPETIYKQINDVDAVGPHVAGTLQNRWKVIKNPFIDEDAYLVGYKGKTFLDAGYVYAPYLPVFSTKAIMLDDFLGRQGFATSYAKKMLNPLYYVLGKITHVVPVPTVDLGTGVIDDIEG